MTFGESIGTCFSKYAMFEGRATRSEYWWFILFTSLASVALSMASHAASAFFPWQFCYRRWQSGQGGYMTPTEVGGFFCSDLFL